MITIRKSELKTYKKKLKSPVAISHIDNIIAGEDTTEQNAIAAVLEFLAVYPNVEVVALCRAMGHEGIHTTVSETLRAAQQAKIEQDLLPKESTEGKKKKADYPEGDVEPDLSGQGDVETRFENTYSFYKRNKETRYGPSDAKLSSMCYALFGEDTCRRIQQTGSWMMWVGHKWEECDEGHLRQQLDQVARLIEKDLKKVQGQYRRTPELVLGVLINRYEIFCDRATEIADEIYHSEVDRMADMISRLESLAGRKSILTIMTDRLISAVKDLDNNRDEIVFTNVAWNAVSNTFYPPRRASLATRSVDVEWKEPSEQGKENWKNYLKGLGFDENTQRFLQRSFGYTMLGRGTAKKFWWFRGEKDTSKTTIIQLVAKSLGSYVETTQTKIWLAKGNSSQGHTDDLARLRGCRMVTADEFPKIGRFDDGLVKQVTGGGVPISASRKGEQGFTFDIHFGMFFSSNYDAYISEDDEALIGRLTALTFKTKVENIDRDFVVKFLSDLDNRLAILAWCMEGAVDFLQHGFGEEPEEIKKSREEYQNEQVSIADQIKEIVEPDPTAVTLISDIKIALVKHQKDTRQTVYFTDKQLSKVMKTLYNVVSDKGSKGQRVYPGIKLIKPPPFDPRVDYQGKSSVSPPPQDDEEYIGGQKTIPFNKSKVGQA